MDSDEYEIFNFLKSLGSEFVSATEIARRAGSKKRFYADRNWAKPILARMVERKILEGDMMGRFRIKPVKKHKGQRWVSPEIAKILKEGGVEAEGASEGAHEIGDDEYYEQL